MELNTELDIDVSIDNLEFGISNVYPNPFNPLVNFDVQLLETENININIYDLKGQKVANIYSGLLQSGSHSLFWNASEFSTGLYIIKCETNHTVSSHKILLMK